MKSCVLIAVLAAAAGSTGGGCNPKTSKNGVKVAPQTTPPAFAFALPPAETNAPSLTTAEARALFRIARLDPLENLESKLRKMRDLPQRVFEKHGGHVAVSLFVPGRREPLIGWAAGGNLAFSTAGAARNALGKRDAAELASARIRIDLIYDLKVWQPGGRMQPGVEGLATFAGNRQVLLLPERFMGDGNTTVKLRDRYMLRLEKLAGMAPGSWKAGKLKMLAMFKSRAVVQLATGDQPVFLYRGNVLAAGPGAAECRAAAERGMAWLRGVQKTSGKFRYVYYPYADTYEEKKYNVVRHAGTAFALFNAARRCVAKRAAESKASNNPTYDPNFRAGERALAYLKGLARVDKRFNFYYVPDGKKVKLGAAALALVALCERERAGGDKSNRTMMNGLAAFLLSQQTPQGEFISHYDPEKGAPVAKFVSLYYPGEALLGLLRLYELGGKKDKKLLAACHLGARYLIKLERQQAAANRKKGLEAGRIYLPDAWFAQALDELIRLDDKPDYRVHLFALADCMIAGQLRDAKLRRSWGQPTKFVDLVGAIDDSDPPSVCATGARCEGIVAALRAARRVKDKARAARYEKALALAARYVVQNGYHAHNAYALPNAKRAFGGFRLTPLSCLVRIDYVQHCAAFLMEWAELQKPAAGAK